MVSVNFNQTDRPELIVVHWARGIAADRSQVLHFKLNPARTEALFKEADTNHNGWVTRHGRARGGHSGGEKRTRQHVRYSVLRSRKAVT